MLRCDFVFDFHIMSITAELLKQFSNMLTEQIFALHAQYEAHMKATNDSHQHQIQMTLTDDVSREPAEDRTRQ